MYFETYINQRRNDRKNPIIYTFILMEITIDRLRFSHLWNSEYSKFVNQIVAIFAIYDPEALHLKKAFGKLLNVLPDLEKVKAQEVSNALSKPLQELDNERDTLLNAIVAQVKAMGKLTMSSIAPHVIVVKRFLDIHGRDIAKANYNSATDRTTKMLADYDAKADVKNAVAALNLAILFDQLSIVNTQFDNLFLQRSHDDVATEKVDARAIRTKTDKALNSFFNGFEFCSDEYDELDYQTPATEMNNMIAYYKTQLKARATRRCEGKDVSKEDPIDGSPI